MIVVPQTPRSSLVVAVVRQKQRGLLERLLRERDAARSRRSGLPRLTGTAAVELLVAAPPDAAARLAQPAVPAVAFSLAVPAVPFAVRVAPRALRRVFTFLAPAGAEAIRVLQ